MFSIKKTAKPAVTAAEINGARQALGCLESDTVGSSSREDIRFLSQFIDKLEKNPTPVVFSFHLDGFWFCMAMIMVCCAIGMGCE